MNLLNILFSGGGEAEEHKENGGGDGGAALHGDHFGKLKDADGHRPALNMGTTSRKGGEDCWGERNSFLACPGNASASLAVRTLLL